jgi:hypothetical protein
MHLRLNGWAASPSPRQRRTEAAAAIEGDGEAPFLAYGAPFSTRFLPKASRRREEPILLTSG